MGPGPGMGISMGNRSDYGSPGIHKGMHTYNMSDYGFSVGAVDTYRSSDAAYYGGTNMGLPKTTGAQFSNTTHRDNVTAQQHMPFFKVDDANGIFIAPYFCASGTNNGEHVFLKYSIAANHVITTSSEVLISGTDPAQGGGAQGHWIATSNPLILDAGHCKPPSS